MDRVFREYIDAEDLQYSGQVLAQAGGLIENGHQQVGAHRDPYLGLHGVLAGAVEGLDPEVLLDPFEEQLDLPAGLVDLRHHDGVELEIVGEENQGLSGIGIHVADAPQSGSVGFLGSRAVEADGLVGPQSGRLVYRSRLPDVEAHVRLRPDHEVSLGRIDAGETPEVEVPPVHDVEGAWLQSDPIQGVHVVDPSLGDRHEGGDRAPEVDHGVDLHCRLRSAEPRPREQGHAKVHDRGVQGVDSLVDLLDVSLLRIQFPRLPDEDSGELEVDAPVSTLVGVGEIAPGDRPAYTHRVEKLGLRAKARLDVAQALPVGELGEKHAQELVSSGKGLRRPRHRILGHATFELLAMEQRGDLRENQGARVHGR